MKIPTYSTIRGSYGNFMKIKILIHYKMNKSVGITIRPTVGVGQELEDLIVKACKSFVGCVIVAEKEHEKRHLHIQMWFDKPVRNGDIKKKFTRICAKFPWWDQAHKVKCIKAKYCFNDWYNDYCIENNEKDDDVSEILMMNPPASTDEYYPSEEEQEKMKAKKKSVNLKYFEIKEQILSQEDFDLDIWDIPQTAEFVLNGMYKHDTIRIIEDHKRRKEFIKSLHWYVKGKCSIINGLGGDDLLKYNDEN